jgi:23S rRNA pseudouridine2605 synthase
VIQEDSTRLNKYLALHLGVSRREADDLIEKGKVAVNGIKSSLGSRVSLGDDVRVNGKSIAADTAFRYIILNKPRGYVSSRRAQGDNPTLYSLLPKELHNLKPVGRLDKDSSGLIFLTNDGDFAYQMTHPKFHKAKIYEVTLNHDLEPLHQQMISDFGIQLEDGRSQLHIERLNDNDRKNWRVAMSEGRNRQIRRTFAALGYTVTKLHRTHFGAFSVNNLKSREFKNIHIDH